MKHDKSKQSFDVGRTLPVRSAATAHASKERAGAPVPSTSPPASRFRPKRIASLVLVALFCLVLIIGIWDAINVSSAAKKTFGSGNIFSLLSPTSLKGSSSGRVNILLVGYSVDDPGHPGATLTDSLLLISLSTTAPKGYMLSIPRDLYVKIPGYGYGKINQVYQDGGIGLLEQIISSDFQVPINYYALIDYAAVRDSVNALGGITVDIKSSDPRGLYDPNISPADGGPLKLANGPQKIDGQTALNLTRARGDAFDSYGFPQADFDRTTHQRQVLAAIKDKLSWKLILNPLANGRVFNAIGVNVKTDISLNEARPLFGLFRRVPSSNLASLSLRDLNGHNYLTSYDSYYSGSALVPSAGIGDYSEIDAALSSQN